MFSFKNLFKKDSYNPLHPEILSAYNATRPMGAQPLVCYAPFRSMYFGHHGRAHTCCYNRTYILGEYPKRSIKDIWFGEEANKLRDYIKHDDFSLGCLGCKQQLVAANFDGVKAKQYDINKANPNRYPSVMEFELSNLCNLECEMCNGEFSSLIRTKREKLPPLEIPYDAEFVKQLEEFIPYLEEVKFYGGEPFLIEIYYDIWEKIMELNPSVRISVQTNATTLNNRVKRILENTNFHINISFDSLQKDTYEEIRKNAVFERTMENIKWLREYTKQRGTFFGISMCAMQQNWRELPDFIKFCNELECPVYFHTVLFPTQCSIRNLEQDAIKEIVDYLGSFTFPEETDLQRKNKQHYNGIYNQIKKWHDDSFKDLRKRKIDTWEDLENIISEHIIQDKASKEDVRAKRREKVVGKLRELRGTLGEEFFKQNVHRFDLDNPFLLDVITFQLEKLPLSVLLVMARNNIT